MSGTHLCQRLSKPQGLVRPEGLGKLKTKIDLPRKNSTRDLPAYSIVPQPLRHREPLRSVNTLIKLEIRKVCTSAFEFGGTRDGRRQRCRENH
jgi:hypothetical protein